MAKRQRTSKSNDATPPDPSEVDSLVQLIGVYHVDVLAEVEGLLRSVTRMQQQVERLRPGPTPPTTTTHRREALKLLHGNLKTLMAKVDTLKETLPEIAAAVSTLNGMTVGDNDDPHTPTDTQ